MWLQSCMKPNAPLWKGWRSLLGFAASLQETGETKEGKSVSFGYSPTTEGLAPPSSSPRCFPPGERDPLPGAPPGELIQLRGVQQVRDPIWFICIGIFFLNPKPMIVQGVSGFALPTALLGSSWHCPERTTNPMGWW